jgi:pilus assembly protein Flp/PilA
MKTFLTRFAADEKGATAIEYALICLLIAVALIGAISSLTPKIANVYSQAANAVPQS